jgi:hypothetical protein
MSFTDVSDQIKILLEDFEVKDLPNIPNLNGIFEQSELTFAIVNGSVEGNYLNLSVNISVASPLRYNDDDENNYLTSDQKRSLDSVVFGIIYKLHRRKLKGCGTMVLQSFENFTPESGKWRSLLTFLVPFYLKFEGSDTEQCLTSLAGSPQ